MIDETLTSTFGINSYHIDLMMDERDYFAGEWHFPNSNYDEAAHNAVDVGR